MSEEPEDDDRRPPHLRSFGRRKGRKPSANQIRLLTELLPRVRLDISQPLPSSLRPRWLEIGFGGAEHLIWQADRHPAIDLIGCEAFQDGIIKALAAVEAKKLNNIRLFDGDGREVLARLADVSIARVFILFPDPWPKARHLQRRLVNGAFASELVRVLQPGGELRLASDIFDYTTQMRECVEATRAFAPLSGNTVAFEERPEDWPPTRYEAKAIREGRKCVFLRFIRKPV